MWLLFCRQSICSILSSRGACFSHNLQYLQSTLTDFIDFYLWKVMNYDGLPIYNVFTFAEGCGKYILMQNFLLLGQ